MEYSDNRHIDDLVNSCLGVCRTSTEAMEYLSEMANGLSNEPVFMFVRAYWGEITNRIERASGINLNSVYEEKL